MGRGHAREELTREYIEAIRHRYVDTDQPTRSICDEFQISIGKLNRLIKAEGWPMRQDRLRDLPPAMKLLEDARMLHTAATGDLSLTRHPEERAQRASKGDGPGAYPDSGPHPSRLGPVDLAPQDDGDGPVHAAAPSPRLRGEGEDVPDGGAVAEAIEPGPHPSRLGPAGLAPQDDGDGPVHVAATSPRLRGEGQDDAAARIEALVLKEIAAEETVRARLGAAPRKAADAAQVARTLATLTQTLQTLRRLRGEDDPDAGKDDDDMPIDLDEFRRELARRIEAFVASQPDDEIVDGAPAALVAPPRP